MAPVLPVRGEGGRDVSAEPEARVQGDERPAAASSLRPFETLARASLVLGTVAGFGLGLLLMLPVAFRVPLELPWLPLAQVHGQVQVLGFTALFIFAVGTVLF